MVRSNYTLTLLKYTAFSCMRLTPAIFGVGVFVFFAIASLTALFTGVDVAEWGGYLQEVYLWRIVRFSLWQAFLSSMLSLLLAIPVASCLSHRQFKGRQWILQLFAVSMVVPTIVAILGLVVVYGQQGWFNRWFGIKLPLYGLLGILLAHVFLNMPLAVRLIFQAYGLIPAGQWRLASQLGFTRFVAFRLIEWPYIKRALPGAFVLMFLLCFSSFAVVLSLGGGPKSSTLEVAIYQALRFDFDLGRAGFLSLLQIAICSLVAVLVYKLAPKPQQDVSLVHVQYYILPDSPLARWMDGVAMFMALLLILPPFIGIFDPLFSHEFIKTLLAESTWRAIWVSLKIAVPAAFLSLALGLCFATLARFALDKVKWSFLPAKLEQLANLILMVPGLVIATGLFLWLRQMGVGIKSSYWIVVWVNAVMALPFVIRAIMPIFYQQEKRFRHLYLSLGLRSWSRFCLEWPLVRKSVSYAFGYALLLSLGDMGVVALFGSQGLTSLPLYLFQLIGSYRLEEGACVAVILIFLCFALFYCSTRFIGGKSHVGS